MSKISYSQILKKEKPAIEEENEELFPEPEDIVKNISLKHPTSNSLFKKPFMVWKNMYLQELEELYSLICLNTGIDIDRKKFYTIMYRCSE
jgi:hypothetical protein